MLRRPGSTAAGNSTLQIHASLTSKTLCGCRNLRKLVRPTCSSLRAPGEAVGKWSSPWGRAAGGSHLRACVLQKDMGAGKCHLKSSISCISKMSQPPPGSLLASLLGRLQTKQIGEHGHSLTHQQGICIGTLRVPHLHPGPGPATRVPRGWCFSHQCAHKPGNPQLCSQRVQALSHPLLWAGTNWQTQGWQSETLGPAPPTRWLAPIPGTHALWPGSKLGCTQQ